MHGKKRYCKECGSSFMVKLCRQCGKFLCQVCKGRHVHNVRF